MARQIDLDSREVKEIKRGGNILPRAKAIYRVKLLDFLEFEDDTNDGYEIKVLIRKAIAPEKQHRDAQPPADVGAELTYRFKNKFKFREEKVRTKQDLRTFLCVMNGEEHNEDFQANKALTGLMKAADRELLEELDEFWLISEIWPGKKPDPDTGKYFINQRLNFHTLDWKPNADAYRKNGADDDEDDDRPTRGRSSSKRRDDDEDEPAPKRRGSRRVDDEDEEDERTTRRRKPADDEDDDRPARGRSRKAADEDDPPPRRTRSRAADDEDEDEPAPKRRGGRRVVTEDEDEEDDRPTRRRR